MYTFLYKVCMARQNGIGLISLLLSGKVDTISGFTKRIRGSIHTVEHAYVRGKHITIEYG
jgi:hypothetical protein